MFETAAAARESYFGFLRAEFPELVAGHDRHYRRKYASKALADGVAARIRNARVGVRFTARRAIVARPARVQLSPLDP